MIPEDLTPRSIDDPMYCSDAEILLAEYVDGTLDRMAKAQLELHLKSCDSCRELAEDATAAASFLARTSVLEVPPELVNRILFQVPSLKPSWTRRVFGPVLGSWLEPALQPRLVMGMGVAALSFFMLAPHVRQLTPSDLNPAKVWTETESQAGRIWERGVRSYQNMRLVYEFESRLNQWQQEAPEAFNQGTDSQPAQDGR